MGEKRVLLGFIKTVNFINKKNSPKLQVPVLTGVFNYFFDIFLATGNGRKVYEFRIDFFGNNSRKCGLTATWWAPQNKTDRFAVFNDLLKDLIVSK